MNQDNLEEDMFFNENDLELYQGIQFPNIETNQDFRRANLNILNEKPKQSRKYIYKKGPEAQRLRLLYQHYEQDYKNCKVFKGLNKHTKADFQNLGRDYNHYFNFQIKNKIMPKFNRDHDRNLGLAVWFFEDILPEVKTWLISTRNLHI